jgi:ornithine carbamoyltransferase
MSRSTTITWPADLLRVGDLTCVSLIEMVDVAARMKAGPDAWADALAGQELACILDGSSMETRLSAEAAAHRLGMIPVPLALDELELDGGDSIGDAARTLSSFASAVVAQNVPHETLVRLAATASVPVINARSAGHHPCQALADLLTLRERFGAIEGLTLAYVGVASNIARSLMEACALAGMHLRLACPRAHAPAVEDLAGAEMLADRHGGSVLTMADPREAVLGADALYTAAWPHTVPRDEAIRAYRVDGKLMRAAAPHAIFMHCLPAHRGEEVTADVIDGRRSVVWEQAANRLPAEQAVIHELSTAARDLRAVG